MFAPLSPLLARFRSSSGSKMEILLSDQMAFKLNSLMNTHSRNYTYNFGRHVSKIPCENSIFPSKHPCLPL